MESHIEKNCTRKKKETLNSHRQIKEIDFTIKKNPTSKTKHSQAEQNKNKNPTSKTKQAK